MLHVHVVGYVVLRVSVVFVIYYCGPDEYQSFSTNVFPLTRLHSSRFSNLHQLILQSTCYSTGFPLMFLPLDVSTILSTSIIFFNTTRIEKSEGDRGGREGDGSVEIERGIGRK